MSTVSVYLAAWFGLPTIAILNETIRERVYCPRMAQAVADRLSTIVGLGLSSLYIVLLTGIAPIESGRLALFIGGMWLVMTIVFEALLDRVTALRSRSFFAKDHCVFTGIIWVLVLLWTWVFHLL